MDTPTNKTTAPSVPNSVTRPPTIGLALGGGGARGLGHVLMLEAFDELGIRPKVIAGTSIGAIYGAAYASGLPARAIRKHTIETLTNRFELLRDVISARTQRAGAVWNLFSASRAFLSPDALLDVILPSGTADDFASLPIPFKVVASDFYAQEQVIFTQGPLRRAVAASMALPVIFEPVVVGERALIDGGLTNPLPFDLLFDEVDVVVAIDVSGEAQPSDMRPHPSALEALFASSFIFERSIIREKLKVRQPDIYIRAGTNVFQILDFLKVHEILDAAEQGKTDLKTQLQRVLTSETLAPADSAPQLKSESKSQTESGSKRRRLLPRLKKENS